MKMFLKIIWARSVFSLPQFSFKFWIISLNWPFQDQDQDQDSYWWNTETTITHQDLWLGN